ncbi:TolC family protein [Synechococcus sp. UW179A]|uniref:TolC family protein n=1 Tax=Synechococcus sp. UW179A TaxID=2575510 RepID=UPI001482AF9A|nr:TolC family protein [Synechococcus sp. UW179A]
MLGLGHSQPPVPSELQPARELLNQSEQINLADAIEATLRSNPQLLAAVETIRARRSLLASEQRRWSPTASFFTYSDATPLLGQYFETDIISYPQNSDESSTYEFNNYSLGSLGLQITWSFLEPSRQPAINRSNSLLEAEQFTFDVIARSIVLDTQISYYELQENQRLIQIYEKIYERNLRQLDIIEEQFRGGLLHIGDVSQQKTLLLSQLTELDGFYRSQLQIASDLARIMGRPPGSSVIPAELSSNVFANWELSLPQTIDEGLALREEIRLSLAEAEADDWEARRLLNLYLPVLSLTANGYTTYSEGIIDGPIGSSNSSDRGNSIDTDLAIGLGFNWNFFDGGVQTARAAANRSLAKAQRQKAQQERDLVGNQIRRSYSAYLTAKLALPQSQEALDTAKRAVNVASARYAAGVGDITTVVQATELLGDAAEQNKSLRLIYRNAIAELYRYSAQWPKPFQPQIRTLMKSRTTDP